MYSYNAHVYNINLELRVLINASVSIDPQINNFMVRLYIVVIVVTNIITRQTTKA